MHLKYLANLYVFQGRKWLPKTGWASSTAARLRCWVVPYILSNSVRAIAPCLSPPPHLRPCF